MCCTCLKVHSFCCNIYLSVCLIGNSTLTLFQMSGKTQVNRAFSLLAILKETLPSNQILAEIYGTHSHVMTFFIIQNESKAVDLASTAVKASGVCFIACKMITLVIVSSCV